MKAKKQFTFATWWTAVYTLAFNLMQTSFSATAALDIVLGAGWVFLLFLVATYSRIFFFTVIPIIFATSGIVTYGEWLMHAPITRNVVTSFFQTNWQEIHGLIGVYSWVWIGGALLLAALCTWHLLHLKLHYHREEKLVITAGFLAVFWLCADLIFRPFDVVKISFHWQHPYDYLEYTTNFFKENISISRSKNKHDISTSPMVRKKASIEPPLQVVIIIGETARADHFGINGYERNTTPLLQKVKNLFSFTDVKSCGTTTMISVPCLMTRATENNLYPLKHETSFVSVFKNLNFKTIWVSEQAKFDRFNTDVSSISNEAELTVFQDNNLTLKTDEFKNYFVNDLVNTENDKLAIFHMIGSHFPYHLMYPNQFRHYTPTCADQHSELELYPAACPRDALINSYDNTIVFTDYFLTKVIGALEKKNAIMFYISDHGEYLGEGGRFLHGLETEDKELRHVPMILWVSEIYKDLNPDKISNMRRKLRDKLSHDNVFHSILDCADIESPLVDKKLSICSK